MCQELFASDYGSMQEFELDVAPLEMGLTFQNVGKKIYLTSKRENNLLCTRKMLHWQDIQPISFC